MHIIRTQTTPSYLRTVVPNSGPIGIYVLKWRSTQMKFKKNNHFDDAILRINAIFTRGWFKAPSFQKVKVGKCERNGRTIHTWSCDWWYCYPDYVVVPHTAVITSNSNSNSKHTRHSVAIRIVISKLLNVFKIFNKILKLGTDLYNVSYQLKGGECSRFELYNEETPWKRPLR